VVDLRDHWTRLSTIGAPGRAKSVSRMFLFIRIRVSHRVRSGRTRGTARCAWVSSMRVRNTGSAVALAKPTVSPPRISCVKSSASGAIVIGIFTRLLALSARPESVEQNRPFRRPEGSGVSDP
jgi:hypothetical protein